MKRLCVTKKSLFFFPFISSSPLFDVLRYLVWLKGGAIFCYFLLFWASGFFGAAEGRCYFCATFCYFLLFWGRQPHQYPFSCSGWRVVIVCLMLLDGGCIRSDALNCRPAIFFFRYTATRGLCISSQKIFFQRNFGSSMNRERFSFFTSSQ